MLNLDIFYRRNTYAPLVSSAELPSAAGEHGALVNRAQDGASAPLTGFGPKMKNLSLYTLLLVLLYFLPLSAQESILISNIWLYGVTEFSDKDVYRITGLRPGIRIAPDSVLQYLGRLDDACNARGRIFSQVDSLKFSYSADSSTADIRVWYSEGEPAYFGQLTLQVDSRIDQQELYRSAAIEPGAVFNPQVLENGVLRILEYLENAGFPLAQAEIITLDVYDADGRFTVAAGLKIIPGSMIILRNVIFKGNEQTRPDLLLSETRLKTGEMFSIEKIRAARNHLHRKGFIGQADTPDILFSGDSADVIFRIHETSSNTFDGIIGYVPAESDREKGFFTGELNIDFKNVLGTGREVQIFWEKIDNTTQNMLFHYLEPWLFGLPVDAGAGFEQQMQDTSYIKRNFRFQCDFRPFTTLTAGLRGGQTLVLPDSAESIRQFIPESKSYRLALHLHYTTLDNELNPRKGVDFQAAWEQGVTRNLGPESLLDSHFARTRNFRILTADFTWVGQLTGNHVMYFHVHGSEITAQGSYIPVSEHIRFGGMSTLRGYRENAFSGTLAAWSNLEYRYLLAEGSRLFLFVDLGAGQSRDREGKLMSRRKAGYGFGIRVRTRLGIVGIDYGLGEGDKLNSAKIHVGLVNKF